MRILHLPFNIASQISIFVRALRGLGHNVRGLVRKTSPIQDCSDLETIDWVGRPNPARRLIRGIHWRLKMVRAMAWAEVVHWHWGDTTWKGVDLHIAAALRKPRLVEFWGDDIRDPQIASRDNPFIARMYQRYPELANGKSRAAQSMFNRAGFRALIPGYELADYLDPSIFPGFYQTRAGLILEDYAPQFPEPNKTRPLLVHCPSNKLKKGTEVLLGVLDGLRGSHEFDFRLVHQLPRTEALAITAACDLFLDQFTIGAEGLASHEAMALGKPVICFIKDSLRQRFPSTLPIVSANQETLASIISELLKDGPHRRELGIQGRRYMEEFHDARKIAVELVEIYRDLAARTQSRKALSQPTLSAHWRQHRTLPDCCAPRPVRVSL